MSSTQKSVLFPSRPNLSLSLAAAVALVLGSQGAQADILTWDANTGTTGVQDGIGTWSTTGNNWWNGTANVSWDTGTLNSVIFGGGISGTPATVTLGSDITVGNITFLPPSSGTTTYTIAGSNTLTLSNTTIDGTASATISASLAGNTGLTITNTGATGTSRSVTLSGNNTYSGPTIIAGGDATKGVQVLRLNSATALGNSADITVGNGSSLQLGTSEVFGLGKTLNLTGTGVNFFGALHAYSSADATWAGTVVLNSGARIGAQSGGKLILSGPIQKGTTGTLVISAYGEVTIAGNQNTYDGNTDILRGVLKLGVDNALPVGTALNVDSSTADEDSIFDLNGYDQTIRALIRTNETGIGGSFVTNDGASVATLTIASNVDQTYSGILQDGISPLALIKSGSGKQTLSGANSYSGDTTVNEGTLVLSGDNTGNTPFIVNGGTLTVSGNNTGDNSLTVNGGTANLSGTIAGNSAVTVNGGTLSVTGTHASSAPVTVNGGTLQVGGAGGTFASNDFRLNGDSFVVENSGTGTNNDSRLSDTANFTLNGGTFLYKGADESGINSSETIGSIILGRDFSTLSVQHANSNTATLTAGQLNRDIGGGIALVKVTSNGRLLFTDDPTLVGGTGATDAKIVPFLLASSTNGSSPDTFVTYDSTNGLRPLDPVTAFENSIVPGANVRIKSTGVSAGTTTAINSLIVSGFTMTIGTAATLTNNSGAVLFTGGTSNINFGTFAFGNREAIITSNSGSIGIITSKITGSNGLSFFGPGTLALGGQSTYIGETVLHSGTLAVTTSSSPTTGAPITSGPFGLSTVVFAGSQIRTADADVATTTVGNALRFEADTTFTVNSGKQGSRFVFTGPVTLAGGTHTLTNSNMKGVTFSGAISDNEEGHGLTFAKSGTGTGSILLSGNNTYTGPTTIQSGTVEVSGSIAESSALKVQNSGSFILSGGSIAGEGRIGDNAPVTLGGGTGSAATFKVDNTTAAFLESVGTLTLLSNSILDLGTGNSGTILHFTDSSSNAWTGNLSILNWTQGTDRLYFGSNQDSLTSTQLSQIHFYDAGGNPWIQGGMLLGDGELVPVPEPSTIFCGVAMLGLIGWRERRRFSRKVAVES